MKTYLLSDNRDTLVGFKFAGIQGEVIQSKDELLDTLENLRNNKEIGIILITEKLSMQIPEKIRQYKLGKKGPLIVEVPDSHGKLRDEDSILRYVKESIGLKIWGDD